MAAKARQPFGALMSPKTGGTEFRKPFDTEATMRGGETDAHGRYWTDVEQWRKPLRTAILGRLDKAERGEKAGPVYLPKLANKTQR
jgi:hypothetical protein